MRSSNPVFREKSFDRSGYYASSAAMTLRGTVDRTFALLVVSIASAFWTWNLFFHYSPAAVTPWTIGGIIGGLALCIAISFVPKWAPYLAPIYAALEGFALGGISAFTEKAYPGIALQAVALTFSVFLSMLAIYRFGIIRITDKFRAGISAAILGILVVYVIDMILSLFGIRIPYIHQSGLIGIGFSLFVIGIAAFSFLLDFDYIENGVRQGYPKYMEWYGAFGLVVTLVWLYVEILNLLRKLRD